ncbi:MAG: PHP domain-containing protein [bacterium]
MVTFADLHIHTTASDGCLSPEKVVAYAVKMQLAAIAIADHDSTESIEKSLEAGKNHHIEIIPSIELSADPLEGSNQELHLLGYWIDWKNDKLQLQLSYFRNARKERALEIIEKLMKINIYLETEELMQIAERSSIGRLHFAQALVAQKFVHNIHEAFDRYLSPGKPAFVPKKKLFARDAIELIIHAKGIPILAHPIYGVEYNIERLKLLMGYGLKGIEVFHPKHSKKAKEFFLRTAQDLGLLITGGSDCHGGLNGNDPQIGSMQVPYSYVEELRKYRL